MFAAASDLSEKLGETYKFPFSPRSESVSGIVLYTEKING